MWPPFQSKEKATSKLNQELESMRLKESQANNKAVTETKRLKQELDQVKDRYGKQVRVFHLLKMKNLFNTNSITETVTDVLLD